MMERWTDKQQDNGKAIATTTDEERNVAFVCEAPSPPSPAWASSLRARSDAQKIESTTITRDGSHLTLDAESMKSHKSKSTSISCSHEVADSKPDSIQKAASGTAGQIERGNSASMPAAQLSQKLESTEASPAHPAGTTEIIRVKAHPRILEKVLGVRYTKINQKVTPVDEDFKHAKLDDHDRLDEAFYRFRRLMSHQRKELRLPGSRKPYGRVVIEEEGPPPKRMACILLRPFRDEMEVTAYHAILSKSTWREHYSPLTLLYEKQRSKLDYVSAHPEARLVDAAPKDTLCGTLALIGNEQRRRLVTIGGILQVEDKLWATTAAHSVSDEDENSTSSTVETLTEDTIRPEEYPEDVAEALIFAKSDGEAQAEPIIPPTYTSADAATAADFTRLRILGDGEESGNDWSLILIKDRAMALPNATHAHGGDGGDGGELGLDNVVYLLDKAARHPGPCDAEVLAGVSGPVAVEMAAGQVEVPLPSGSWVTAWECLVKSSQCEFFNFTCQDATLRVSLALEIYVLKLRYSRSSAW